MIRKIDMTVRNDDNYLPVASKENGSEAFEMLK